MQIDSQGLPEELAAKVDAAQERYATAVVSGSSIMLIKSADSPRAVGSGLYQTTG